MTELALERKRIRNRLWNHDNPDRMKIARQKYWKAHPDRQRARIAHHTAKFKLEFPEVYRDRMRRYRHKWYLNNKHKQHVQKLLQEAIAMGIIVRPEKCSNCNKACKPVAHHPDYDFPYEVEFLCNSCHQRLHAELRKNNIQCI